MALVPTWTALISAALNSTESMANFHLPRTPPVRAEHVVHEMAQIDSKERRRN